MHTQRGTEVIARLMIMSGPPPTANLSLVPFVIACAGLEDQSARDRRDTTCEQWGCRASQDCSKVAKEYVAAIDVASADVHLGRADCL